MTVKEIVSCPHCHRPHRVAKSTIGKNGKCSGCKSVFLIQTTSKYSEAFAHALASVRPDKKRTEAKASAPKDETEEEASAASLAKQIGQKSASSKWTKFDLSSFDLWWFLACVAAIVCGPIVLVSGFGEQGKEKLWAKGTGTTQGVVTKTYTEKTGRSTSWWSTGQWSTDRSFSGRRRRTYYRIDVSYHVDGATYELKNQNVDFSVFSRYEPNRVGSAENGVEVEYSIAAPSVAMIEGQRLDSFGTLALGTLLLVVGILGMCYFFVPKSLSLEE